MAYVTQEELDECKRTMNSKFEELHADILEIKQNTTEIRDIYKSAKTFYRVSGWIGDVIRKVALVGGSIALMYAWAKGLFKY